MIIETIDDLILHSDKSNSSDQKIEKQYKDPNFIQIELDGKIYEVSASDIIKAINAAVGQGDRTIVHAYKYRRTMDDTKGSD